MPSLSYELARLIALVIVFVPVMIVNLRSGELPNWGAAAVLVTGLVIGLFRPDPLDLPWLFWTIGSVIWIGLFAALRVPAGLVKIAMAFLPWFQDAGEYLAFVTIAMGITAAAGFLLRRALVPVAPGLLVAGASVFALAAVG